MILLVKILFANSVCYHIDKKYIKTNLEPSESLLIDIGNMFNNPQKDEYNITRAHAIIEFDTPRYVPYLSGAYLECSQEEKGVFYCAGDCDGGHLSVKKKEDGIYFKIEGARMSETTDDPVIYEIQGKPDLFIRGEEKSCFQPTLDAMIDVKNFEQNREKEKIINALKNLKDIIIYDVDYKGQMALAVGEDNSLDSRKKSFKNEFHLGTILYSNDHGKQWHQVFEGNIPLRRGILLDEKKAIVLGFIDEEGGSISSVVKRTDDAGKHWKTIYKGKSLRDIIQHNHGFFAVGEGIFYSKEGEKWEKVLKVEEEKIYTILSLDSHRLIAAGDRNIFFSKDDGKSWKAAEITTDLSGDPMEYIYQKNDKLYIWVRHPDGFGLVSDDDGEHWKGIDFYSNL